MGDQDKVGNLLSDETLRRILSAVREVENIRGAGVTRSPGIAITISQAPGATGGGVSSAPKSTGAFLVYQYTLHIAPADSTDGADFLIAGNPLG